MCEEWKIVVTAIVTIVGSVVVFSLGQIVQRFLIEPIHNLNNTIGQIESAIRLFGDVINGPGSGSEDRQREASMKLRELSASLRCHIHVINDAAYRFAWSMPSKTDLREAASSLMGISNSLSQERHLEANLKNIEKVRRCLRIPAID